MSDFGHEGVISATTWLKALTLVARVDRFIVLILEGRFGTRPSPAPMMELSRSAKVAKEGLLYSPRRRASKNLSRSVNVLGQSDKYSRRWSAEDDIWLWARE